MGCIYGNYLPRYVLFIGFYQYVYEYFGDSPYCVRRCFFCLCYFQDFQPFSPSSLNIHKLIQIPVKNIQ